MYYLKTENSFDSAHFLKGYAGKCRNLHGHRWRVVVEIAADQLKDEGQTRGMLVDFSDLKNYLKNYLKKLKINLTDLQFKNLISTLNTDLIKLIQKIINN